MKEQGSCEFPGCITKLSSYNKEGFCFLHYRVMTQHNLIYSKDKYYAVKTRQKGGTYHLTIPRNKMRGYKELFSEEV